MGSDSLEDAAPAHRVCLDSFRIARREVSRREFAVVMGRHPWRQDSAIVRGPELPAVHVYWDDARLYCHRIGRRLPTEAEFEFLLRGTDSPPPWKDSPASACRWANLGDSALNRSEADVQASFDSAIGDDEDGDYADWKMITSRRSEIFPCHDGFPGPAPRGRFPADRRGILDLWGNVAEWTADRYGSYEDLPERNPIGAEMGGDRVVRGGSWKSGPSQVTPWSRSSIGQFHKDDDLGFRCAAD
jgi:formylglycine-generating enzyme required for sulfatase activity